MNTGGMRLRKYPGQVRKYRRLPRKRRGLTASYTVEAAYVMTIVLLSISFLIRTAYGWCMETTGMMRLHHMVEYVRCQEDEEQRGGALRKGGKVYGTMESGDRKREIEAGVYEPESRMRILTIFDNMAEGDRDDGGAQEAGSPFSQRTAAELSDDCR